LYPFSFAEEYHKSGAHIKNPTGKVKRTDLFKGAYNDMDNKDLGTKGSKNTLKGKVKEAAGKVEEAVGKATDNPKVKAKGAAKRAEGKTQSAAGRAERKIDQALDPEKS
jgi:uncharacterized protein YjbJ (UPF0337 family)